MLGHDLDPLVTIEWVKFGEVFGRACGVDALCKEGLAGLAVGSGLCRWSREEREGKPDNSFRRPKTSDVRPTIMLL